MFANEESSLKSLFGEVVEAERIIHCHLNRLHCFEIYQEYSSYVVDVCQRGNFMNTNFKGKLLRKSLQS